MKSRRGERSPGRARWRWLLLLPLLALVWVAADRVGQGVEPRYEATAVAAVDGADQPYSGERVYGNLRQTNLVMGAILNADETKAQVRAQGLADTYLVTPLDRRRILELEVLTEDPDLSLQTLAAVLEIGAHELEARQTEAGLPEESRYSLRVLAHPSLTETVPSGMRNMIVVAALGAVLSVLLVLRLPVRRAGLHRAATREVRSGHEGSSKHGAGA